MNESLVKYLAGLMDADGSLSFAFKCDPNKEDCHYLSLTLTLASSDAVDRAGFIESLPALTGFGTVSRYGKTKQFKTWAVNKRADVEMLVPRLIKHMVIKAKHWSWLLEQWRESRGIGLPRVKRDELSAASKDSRKRVGPLRHKNYPTWAWVAGYLDGDGWYRHRYSASANYWSMHVGAVAHATDMHGLLFLRETFGGSIRDHGQSPLVRVWVRNLGVKDSSFALRFLPKVAKHSRLKRQKIDQMIHHHRQRLSVPGPTGQATV